MIDRLAGDGNWLQMLERMENTRLPKHVLNYKPRGRRDCGRPRKRWQGVDAGTDDDDNDGDDDGINA